MVMLDQQGGKPPSQHSQWPPRVCVPLPVPTLTFTLKLVEIPALRLI